MTWPTELSLQTPPVSPVQLALFAAAAGDHNPLHLDAEAARRAGLERPVVHGMLSMALAGRLFTHRLGPGCVRRLHTRFTGVALVGDVIDLTATLDRVDGELAHYTLRGLSGRGGELISGSATVGPAR